MCLSWLFLNIFRGSEDLVVIMHILCKQLRHGVGGLSSPADLEVKVVSWRPRDGYSLEGLMSSKIAATLLARKAESGLRH